MLDPDPMPSFRPGWQRDTDHASSATLLTFLESDLDRGMRLAWHISASQTLLNASAC